MLTNNILEYVTGRERWKIVCERYRMNHTTCSFCGVNYCQETPTHNWQIEVANKYHYIYRVKVCCSKCFKYFTYLSEIIHLHKTHQRDE